MDMNRHADNRKPKSGFTLIEMLISLSIFAVVTAMAVANFRAGAQGDELRVAARLLASTTRRAQTQSVAGTSVFFCHGGSEEGKVCPSGEDIDCVGGSCIRDIPDSWGVRISTLDGENRAIAVFADTNGNRRLDEGEAVRYESLSPGPFVRVVGVEPDDSGVIDIVFTPPKPKIAFNDSEVDGLAIITLEHDHSNAQQTVTVNRISGLVTVE